MGKTEVVAWHGRNGILVNCPDLVGGDGDLDGHGGVLAHREME